MKPRSIVLNLYGDYVRYRGGQILLGRLSQLIALFGVPEETLRVTLSRMAKAGWLDSRRVGRHSVYALTERGWRLLDEGRARIFQRQPDPWAGEWCLIHFALPEAEREVRDRLRRDLAWLGFGPLGPTTWLAPRDARRQVESLLAELGLAERAHLFLARSRGLAEDRQLVARGWDLAALNRRYAEFLAEFAPKAREYRAARRVGAPWPDQRCLIERLELVHAYRKFPFDDPDLPAQLLPADWLGRQAHALFGELYAGWEAAAFAAYDQIVGDSLQYQAERREASVLSGTGGETDPARRSG